MYSSYCFILLSILVSWSGTCPQPLVPFRHLAAFKPNWAQGEEGTYLELTTRSATWQRIGQEWFVSWGASFVHSSCRSDIESDISAHTSSTQQDLFGRNVVIHFSPPDYSVSK